MNLKKLASLMSFGLCAMLFAHESQAQATSYASFGGLSIVVIDLDPNDGVAATFSLTQPYYNWVGAAGYPDDTGAPDPKQIIHHPGQVDVTTSFGHAYASYDGTGYASQSTSAHAMLAGATLQGHFLLSANTTVIFSSYAKAGANNSSNENSNASVALYAGELVGSDTYLGGYYQDWIHAYENQQQRLLSLSFTSAPDQELSGWFGISAHADSTPRSPVPEPETYMLLLAGLGLISASAHRRKTRK